MSTSNSVATSLLPVTASPETALLLSITNAQAGLVQGTPPPVVFEGLLRDVLGLTESEYGFIGEA